MTINFKIVSPDEAIAIAMTEARASAAEILKLANTPGETPEGQALKVFRHAINLANAFDVLNQIADLVHEDEREARRHNDSPRKDPEAGVSRDSN